MKTLVSLFAVFLLCSCIYDVPFVDLAELPVKMDVVGVWEKIPDEGKASDPDDKLVILPFSGHEYIVVSSPAENGLYFRAYPVQVGDSVYIQLEWLGAEKNPYHLCRYTVKDGILTIELLDEGAVSPEIASSADLRKALQENLDNPELFTEAVSYRKLDN